MKPAKKKTGDRKIRIAYLINHFGKGGGTENQLATLIRNIDRSRFEPYLIVLKPLWEEMELNFGCEIVFLNLTSVISLKLPFLLWRLVRLLRSWRIDILQMFFYDARIIGSVAGTLAGVKYVVPSRRDFGFNVTTSQLRILRFLNQFIDHILTNSNQVARMVAATEKFPLTRITCVHNGIDIVSTGNPCPLESRGIHLDPNRPVVGMVANLRPVKRIDRFLQMASRLRDKSVQFVIIGRGQESENYHRMARDLGIADRTCFKYITCDVDKIMQKFTVGLLTSQSEGLSNSLIELSLNGIPAVAFDVGGNAEVIEDGKTGFILPDDDIAGLTEKVEYLLDNPEVAIDMGKQGKLRARNMFSVETMVKATEEFYLRLLNASETEQGELAREIHVSK